MNNQSLIGRLKEVLSWVCTRSGRKYVEYNEKGSTRQCHACHYTCPEGLSPEIRLWECPGCQRVHIRDENAAHHGLERTLRAIEMPCSGHTPVKVRWIWEVRSSGIAEMLRGSDSLTDQLDTAKELNQARDSA